MYTAAKTLPTIRRVDLIGKKEFAATVFDVKDEFFVTHVVFIRSNLNVHLFYIA